MDLAVGQIPRSAERISSLNINLLCFGLGWVTENGHNLNGTTAQPLFIFCCLRAYLREFLNVSRKRKRYEGRWLHRHWIYVLWASERQINVALDTQVISWPVYEQSIAAVIENRIHDNYEKIHIELENVPISDALPLEERAFRQLCSALITSPRRS